MSEQGEGAWLPGSEVGGGGIWFEPPLYIGANILYLFYTFIGLTIYHYVCVLCVPACVVRFVEGSSLRSEVLT